MAFADGYSENDIPCGFVTDRTETHFTVRDFLLNTTGTVDTNKELVVKYNCEVRYEATVLQNTQNYVAIGTFSGLKEVV